MKKRCLLSTTGHYHNYGGRGITVCDRWRDSFENFLADMGEQPPGMSVDRIDNDGNYEPGNCRWATVKEQGNNRRTNVLVTHEGETLTIQQWADRKGLKTTTLHRRLAHGWDVRRALESPIQANKSHARI